MLLLNHNIYFHREALLASVNSLFDAFSGDSGSAFGAADEHLPKVRLLIILLWHPLLIFAVVRNLQNASRLSL